jgi:molybdopterin molybdotransferase
VAGDEAGALSAALQRGLLEADVLVTTGGVSRGETDLVRPCLEALGVKIVFHGVALQPGKPALFGAHDRGWVFGLPGNPVSALVCAELFLIPALAQLSGDSFEQALRTWRGRLTRDVKASPKRRRVFPCLLDDGAVEPLPWRSSADLYTLARANAYMIVEPKQDLARGDEVRCLIPGR